MCICDHVQNDLFLFLLVLILPTYSKSMQEMVAASYQCYYTVIHCQSFRCFTQSSDNQASPLSTYRSRINSIQHYSKKPIAYLPILSFFKGISALLRGICVQGVLILCPDGISKHRISYQWIVTAVSPPEHSDVKTGFRSTSCFFQQCLHFEVQNTSLSFYIASVCFFF